MIEYGSDSYPELFVANEWQTASQQAAIGRESPDCGAQLVAQTASSRSGESPPAEIVLKPITPTLRKRLQKYYGYGAQKQKDGDFDYAHAMFSQCAVADPANITYVESMLNNLFAKYRGQKKKPKVRLNRNNFKKAISQEDWLQVLKLGPEFLEQNPWDVTTLRGMAQACAGLRQHDEQFNDIELRYLRTALDASPKDIDVNKHCAESLARMGQFDQAIACWHRIEELSSNKSDAQQQISELTVLKNMRANGMLDETSGSQIVAAKPKGSDQAKDEASDSQAVEADDSADDTAISSSTGDSGVDELEEEIARNPAEVMNYVKLARLHEVQGDLLSAEAVLRRAMSVSGNDLRISERLETIQILQGRRQLKTAENQYQKAPTEDHRELVQRLKTELNRLELGIYNNRAQRYPDKLKYRYELAICLKRAGNFKEAADYFQQAGEEPQLAAAATVQRGECLQQVRQYQEAMQCYLGVANRAENVPVEVQKLAYYRAGVLAMGLKDQHQASQLLGQLADLDSNYRDVRARLDKLKKMGDT